MDVALLASVPALLAPIAEPLQTVPEFFDRPYGRLLLGALLAAVVIFVGRVLLAVTWRFILVAVFVFAVLFVGAAIFGPA